jgi:hypothetical protein
VDRGVRLIGGSLAAVALLLATAASTMGLSCVVHEDVQSAAEEAVAGEHPGWADAYVVARLDEIELRDGEPITLTVTPTHVFGGRVGTTIRLGARADGPPPPADWTIGELYFLALSEVREVEAVEAVVAPCAPNFRITDQDAFDRLIRAARTVEVRQPEAELVSTDLPSGVVVGISLAAIGLGSWLAFRRRSRSDEPR